MTAKKKRKAGKAARGRGEVRLPSSQFTRWESVGLPLFGAAALVAGWLAFLGALSGGRMSWMHFMQLDNFRPWMMFHNLGSEFGPFGWAPALRTWIPEIAMLWGLYALGADAGDGAALFPILNAALSAAGWILVCDLVFGKSPVRRAAVLILHALPMLSAAYGRLDIFYHLLAPLWRGGLWAVTPWILWLSLRALEADNRRDAARFLVGVGVLTAVVANDFAAVAWHVAPATAAALALAVFRMVKWRAFFRFAAVFIVAVPVGRLADIDYGQAAHFLQFSNFAHMAAVLRLIGSILALFIERNPLEAAAWAALAAIVAVRFFIALFAAWRGLKKGGANKSPSIAGGLLGVAGRRDIFVALFVVVAMLAPVAATLTRAGFGISPAGSGLHDFLHVSSHRYFMPFFYFPLFIGWALLPWSFSGWGRRGSAALVGAAVVVVALAGPRALSISAEGLDPFATSFHQCFVDNARRLNWRGGISHSAAVSRLYANPDAGIDRIMGVRVRRDETGGREIVLMREYNRNWWHGDFQFVTVNGVKGRLFFVPPPWGPDCATTNPDKCPLGDYGQIVDGDSARAVFGEPSEVVDCEGYNFFHYDPPLRFDSDVLRKVEWRGTGDIPLGRIRQKAEGAD